MTQNAERDVADPSADHLKASVQEAIGKLTGDLRMEAEGRRQKRDTKPKGDGKPRAR